jgi:hypothetical protein
MRLGRIASPDGVAFVSIEGDLDDPSGMSVREIAEHPFGTPTFTGRSWPLADVRAGDSTKAHSVEPSLATIRADTAR